MIEFLETFSFVQYLMQLGWLHVFLYGFGIAYLICFCGFVISYKCSGSEREKNEMKDEFIKVMFGFLIPSFFWPALLPIAIIFCSFVLFKEALFFILDYNFSEGISKFKNTIGESIAKFSNYIKSRKKQTAIKNAIENNKPVVLDIHEQNRIIDIT